MSQDIFQMHMDHITNWLTGIIAIHDYISVYGHTSMEHDRYFTLLIQVAMKNGLMFNSTKYKTELPNISFYGTIFTSQGIKPDPSKVQALQDLPTTWQPDQAPVIPWPH